MKPNLDRFLEVLRWIIGILSFCLCIVGWFTRQYDPIFFLAWLLSVWGFVLSMKEPFGRIFKIARDDLITTLCVIAFFASAISVGLRMYLEF